MTMPLKDLPEYIKSARGGQDEVPVVEMGRIVSPSGRSPFLLAVACILLILVAGVAVSTHEIKIGSAAGAENVAEIVSGEGGRVVSVSKDGEGDYRVRVFTFGGVKSLVERLRGKEEFESVDF